MHFLRLKKRLFYLTELSDVTGHQIVYLHGCIFVRHVNLILKKRLIYLSDSNGNTKFEIKHIKLNFRIKKHNRIRVERTKKHIRVRKG